MCGIGGIIHFTNKPVESGLIHRMMDAMAHRGPDAEGFFIDHEVALGHRRLSIIDLSDAANQPFIDNSNRYVLIFNGEIYNYEEVKPLLPGYSFRTTSDTEMIIAAYATWGDACLQYFRGMFTIAIWDKKEKEIFIARDRMGVKPLYYFVDEDKLVFASEIRAILETGLVKKKIDRAALLDYFSCQSIPYPHSVVENIQQLGAGSWIKIKNGKTEKKAYWDLTNNDISFDFNDKQKIQEQIRKLMLQSVKRRLVSDVPVGAFLSGGIDSGAVVGLMAEAANARPNTFTIVFDEIEFDESYYAGLVAKKFNSNHTQIVLKPNSFLDELHNALNAMDIPSGDGINTYVVSKAVRQKGMAVALSGIGGDELFAGYPYFNQYLQLRDKEWLWKLPLATRKFVTSWIGAKKERMQQLMEVNSPSIDQVYPIFRQILSPGTLGKLTSLTVAGNGFNGSLELALVDKKENLQKLPLLSQVSAVEYLGYTQHTLLKDTDQMSMASALEVREPFFDQDLVEFVMAVPDKFKKPQYPKSLLVESLKPLLPDEIVFRKKQGFLFPWKFWLRNELRSFCDMHIKNISKRDFIKGGELELYWQSFLQGNENIRWMEIWLFVVLEYWMEKNGME